MLAEPRQNVRAKDRQPRCDAVKFNHLRGVSGLELTLNRREIDQEAISYLARRMLANCIEVIGQGQIPSVQITELALCMKIE